MSFTPIQKFSYTSGKNSTDGALIIDAMDILHDNVVDGFCIVSSDSDYTGLAKRIREQGVFVMGIGEQKTPTAFVQSCEIFTYCENIGKSSESIIEPKLKKKIKTNTDKLTPNVNLDLIDKAFLMANREDSEVLVSTIGFNLRKIDPSFDYRTFGFSNLTNLIDSFPEYEIVKIENGGVQHNAARRIK
jgi:hypothetical protein